MCGFTRGVAAHFDAGRAAHAKRCGAAWLVKHNRKKGCPEGSRVTSTSPRNYARPCARVSVSGANGPFRITKPGPVFIPPRMYMETGFSFFFRFFRFFIAFFSRDKLREVENGERERTGEFPRALIYTFEGSK